MAWRHLVLVLGPDLRCDAAGVLVVASTDGEGAATAAGSRLVLVLELSLRCDAGGAVVAAGDGLQVPAGTQRWEADLVARRGVGIWLHFFTVRQAAGAAARWDWVCRKASQALGAMLRSRMNWSSAAW